MTIQLRRPILHHNHHRHLLAIIAGVVLLTSSSSSYCSCCHGLILQSSFKLPQIRLPWDNNDNNDNNAAAAAAAVQKDNLSSSYSLRSKDTILIFGGTGGVGQLVVRKLLCRRGGGSSDGYTVRVAARNPSRAYELLRSTATATTTIEDDNIDTTTNIINNANTDRKLEVVQVDLVSKTATTDDELRSIMLGVSAIVISVGTTAFPTSRWFSSSSSENKYEIINTPSAIDNGAVSRIGQIAATISTIRQIVLVTSIGTTRTNVMPFAFLNLFGVLDSKRAGENAIIQLATSSNNNNQNQKQLFSYTIIRPGRLVGGPYTNLDIANLLQITGGIGNRVSLAQGDTLLGDCKRTSVAEAVVRCLELDACTNIDFSIIDNEEKEEENASPLTDDEWIESFASMKKRGEK